MRPPDLKWYWFDTDPVSVCLPCSDRLPLVLVLNKRNIIVALACHAI